MRRFVSALFVFAACSFAAFAQPNPPTLAIGATAPDFVLTNVDGRVYSLKDFAAAKVLVLVFTCTHCPSAQLDEGRIKQIATDYKDRGVMLAAISSSSPKGLRLDEIRYSDLDDSFESMKIRARDRGFNYPYLYDGDSQTASQAYGPVATPHFFIFDAERKLRYEGRLDDDERGKHITKNFVRDAIDAVLAGKEPPVTRTKVVGCSTKWANKEPMVRAWNEKMAARPVTLEKADETVLAALRKNDSGKLRLVKFWATWCAPCVSEFPEFVTMDRIYNTREFEFVSVAVNKPDESDKALEVLKKMQAGNKNYIFASDDRDKLINAFEKEWQGEVPYIVLISPEGKIVYRQSGSIDALEMRRAIVKELDARKPW